MFLPISHQHHVGGLDVGGLGTDCRYCHGAVEQSTFAGMPPAETCMTCHSQIWTRADMLEPVRRSLATGRPIRWTRVHDLADHVQFSHGAHVSNRVSRTTCHGAVDEMPLMRQAAPLTIGWCLDCHRLGTRHQVGAGGADARLRHAPRDDDGLPCLPQVTSGAPSSAAWTTPPYAAGWRRSLPRWRDWLGRSVMQNRLAAAAAVPCLTLWAGLSGQIIGSRAAQEPVARSDVG